MAVKVIPFPKARNSPPTRIRKDPRLRRKMIRRQQMNRSPQPPMGRITIISTLRMGAALSIPLGRMLELSSRVCVALLLLHRDIRHHIGTHNRNRLHMPTKNLARIPCMTAQMAKAREVRHSSLIMMMIADACCATLPKGVEGNHLNCQLDRAPRHRQEVLRIKSKIMALQRTILLVYARSVKPELRTPELAPRRSSKRLRRRGLLRLRLILCENVDQPALRNAALAMRKENQANTLLTTRR